MNKLYVLEGLDGSGKTTIGKKLSELINSEFIKTPTQDFSPLKEKIFTKPYEIQFLFFMASNLDASYKIKELLKSSSVICDRYFYTTIVAYCTYTGTSLDKIIEFIKPIKENLIMPNKTILLSVSLDEWIRRLSNRKLDLNDQRLFNNEERYNKIMQLYDKFVQEENWIVFDTSSKTVEESANELFSILKI